MSANHENLPPTDFPLNIIRFWKALELFSATPVPKSERNDRCVSTTLGNTLPWKSDLHGSTEQKPGKKFTWRHEIWLNTYSSEAIYAHLQSIMQDKNAYDLRSETRAMAYFVVNEQGILDEESLTLSSAAWALGSLADYGHTDQRWSTGFESANESFKIRVKSALYNKHRQLIQSADNTEDTENQQYIIIDYSDIELISHQAAIACQLCDTRGMLLHKYSDICTEQHWAKSTKVRISTSLENTPNNMLNSFFFADLELAENTLQQGTAPKPLLAYLRFASSPQFLDVRNNTEKVDELGLSSRAPLGKWPANPAHSLSLSQQFAVNLASADDANPVMGVNGPPGTGKTTLLRDLIASIVVKRAVALSQFQQPTEAFTNFTGWTVDNKQFEVPVMCKSLTGYEILVASSNNSAVENLTRELPAEAAIGEDYLGIAEYFSTIASRVMNSSDLPKDWNQRKAWGLISARLGNKANRRDFINRFWWPIQQNSNAGSAPSHTDDAPEDLPAEHSMKSLLEHYAATPAAVPDWKTARAEFLAAKANVERLQRAAEDAWQHLQKLKPLNNLLTTLEKNKSEAMLGLRKATQYCYTAEAALTQTEKDESALQEKLRLHERGKPGIFIRFFKRNEARQWNKRFFDLSAKLSEVEGLKYKALNSFHAIQAEKNAYTLACQKITIEFDRTKALLEQLVSDIQREVEYFGIAHPCSPQRGDKNSIDLSQFEKMRELIPQFSTSELNKAQAQLFLQALQLHKAFIANCAGLINKRMSGLVDVVSGRAPKTVDSQTVAAAWQLLFLFVPVISTTFASAGRMLNNLPTSSLGYLFIDEAGQATPQSAVGAILRAKRVVAVGDPFQLQPISNVPYKLVKNIAATYSVSERWLPPTASVQTLADQVTNWGTKMRENLWVGMPLRAHRRCQDPMFTFCNKVAYDSLMIHGQSGTKQHIEKLEPSRWFHSPQTNSGQTLQPGDCQMVREIMCKLENDCINPADIILISPFKEIADYLRETYSTTRGSQTRTSRAGTIHTAQGREAEVVILVLGGDPDKPGQLDWAAETVNLVNVAVSRAKSRLYVVGDRDKWKSKPFFSDLSKMLPS